MTYSIAPSDVLDGFSTGASTADLTAYIAVVDQADTCLLANGVDAAIGKQLKILAVRHLAENANSSGVVTSERAVSGAARTYRERKGDETGHLETLRIIDRYGCVLNVINKNARVQLRSVGRRAPETS